MRVTKEVPLAHLSLVLVSQGAFCDWLVTLGTFAGQGSGAVSTRELQVRTRAAGFLGSAWSWSPLSSPSCWMLAWPWGGLAEQWHTQNVLGERCSPGLGADSVPEAL